jgi:hypothetical protein
MICGLVRMIDDPAQSTGLIVKVDDQRRELCLGNKIYRGHTLARYKFAFIRHTHLTGFIAFFRSYFIIWSGLIAQYGF